VTCSNELRHHLQRQQQRAGSLPSLHASLNPVHPLDQFSTAARTFSGVVTRLGLVVLSILLGPAAEAVQAVGPGVIGAADRPADLAAVGQAQLRAASPAQPANSCRSQNLCIVWLF
jgi:hypothetical protein